MSATTKTTPTNDWGQGRTWYLDRHHVACDPGTAMSRFKLTRPSDPQIAYSYSCAALPGDRKDAVQQKTPMNDDGGGNVIYLDRHNVQCPVGSALQYFHLDRDGTGRMLQYTYSCVPSPYLGRCYQRQTPANDDGGGHAGKVDSAIYLDRHNVACKDGEVLTQFRLARAGSDASQIMYQYTCCANDLPPPPPPPPSAPPPPPAVDAFACPTDFQPCRPGRPLQGHVLGEANFVDTRTCFDECRKRAPRCAAVYANSDTKQCILYAHWNTNLDPNAGGVTAQANCVANPSLRDLCA